jgi:hypothetical protein
VPTMIIKGLQLLKVVNPFLMTFCEQHLFIKPFHIDFRGKIR